jgi:hypothetical protein
VPSATRYGVLPLGVRAALLLSLLLLGCAKEGNHATPAGSGDAPPAEQLPDAETCLTPQTGCACDEEAQVVDCGHAVRKSGDYVWCSMGTRVCEKSVWGACEGDKLAMIPNDSEQAAQALGKSTACVTNPCDPYCQLVVDDARGLDIGDAGLTANDAGLALLERPFDPLTGVNCTGISLTPATQQLKVTKFNLNNGLLGEYFNRRDNTITQIPATWVVTAKRIDATVDFNWGTAAPGPAGIGVDDFTIRWTGFVKPPASGAYVFYTRTDDGARLWINDVLVLNKWIEQGATSWPSISVNLTQGTLAKIRYEYFEHGSGASAQLLWSSATIAQSVVPEANLVGPDGDTNPFTVVPATANITLGLIAPDCYDGPVTAAWTLDKLDRATISSTGTVTLASPVAGLMKVGAFVQQFSAAATVNVIVDATDVVEAPTGSEAIFAGSSSGADTTTLLYPYDATVLPLALKPPLIQWADSAAIAPTAIKISLRYPATGAVIFAWSKIMAPPVTPRYAVPREVWSYFERTAKGASAAISVQRIVSGSLKNAISKTITFASAPLRGKIFYTQYGRSGGSKVMRLDPAGDILAQPVFPGDTGCPVCHSMSADGSKFATAPATGSTNGGISKVDADGNLTVLSDFVLPSAPYSTGQNDWRGFAWAPLTPDGSYLLGANNIWGNSSQTVVGIDPVTRLVTLPLTMLSSGNGTGLVGDYYSTSNFTGVSWRRFDPKINFDFSVSPGGPVPAHGYSVVWTGQVEPFYSESYSFEVETTAGVRLTVGSTVLVDQLTFSGAATKFSGSIAMTRGTRANIRLEAVDKNAETLVKLSWSSLTTPYGQVPQSMLYPNVGLHGAQVKFVDTLGGSLTQLEADISDDWGTNRPALSIAADNFTSTWDALVEAPATGNLQWCLKADQGATLSVDGVTLINSAVIYNACATAVPVIAGKKYAIHLVHTELTGTALLQLSWLMPGIIPVREDVPNARIFPPASYVAPTNGLAVTWYDTSDFGGSSLAINSLTPQAFNSFVPTVGADWAATRPSWGRSMTSSDTFSGRFTGRLKPSCSGIHEFQIIADDFATLWLAGQRVVSANTTAKSGAVYLDSATYYDFKLDYYETTTNAKVSLKWKPDCDASTLFVDIPTANLTPAGDTTLAGYVRGGGDDGNGYNYYVWQTPNAVGELAIDVTTQKAGQWGLGNSVMMVPSFAPDGSKLVFVDGDSADGAGWRKGLSTFDFSQAQKTFKNRRLIVSHWPFGDVIKWPTYESDSKSVIFQTTVPGDVCCRNNWTKYGYMGPTNYFEDPGKLWSVDTSAASPNPVLLAKLTNGERVEDRNKSYQPTMLPSSAGGYRWAVFTSTRPYGNVVNLPAVQQDFTDVNNYVAMTNSAQLQSQLWVSAVDNAASAGTDRSHPAFWLPNQAYNEVASSGSLNERAYWVAEACRAPGAAAASLCDVDEDCCGGNLTPATAVCRIDAPVTVPPIRHCAAVPPVNSCIAVGGACSTNADCCFGNPCAGGICTKPPSLASFTPENFVRQYASECGRGTQAIWRFFDWQAVTPAIASKIEIYAESADDPTTFTLLPKAPAPVTLGKVIKVATVTGATVAGWVGQDIGALLKAAKLPQLDYLRITLRLSPNSKSTATPLLSNWRQSYSCPPAE